MEGQCGLCQESTEIVDSHLIPAGFYRLMRTESQKNPNPVHVGKGKANTTSDQISGHFLCKECEQRFNRGGEKYVLDNCCRSESQFGLREMVESLPEIAKDGGTSFRKLGPAEDEMSSQCTYFAASVFWRASARKWRIRNRDLETITLGPYEERFRLFLLGKAQFPNRAALIMQVSSDPVPDNVMLIPSTSRIKGYIRHKLYVPGLLFNLFVGKTLPAGYETIGLAPNPSKVFYSSNWGDDWFRENTLKAANAKRVGKFASKR